MDRPVALVVVAADDELHRSLAATAVGALSGRLEVVTLDLVDGFVPAMSATEWRSYRSGDPIRHEQVAEHARLVVRAEVMVFVFATEWWSPPPVLKAWLERVLVPGVAFVFDHRGHVRPNLHELRAIVGITTYRRPRRIRRWGGDGARRTLLRALRLNVPHRVRRLWIATDRQRGRLLIERIGSELSRL